MLLTLTTTHLPATDLGHLLHKNPDRLQTFEHGFGKSHIFYPEASAERCTAALLLDVDPVALVRGRGGSKPGANRQLEHYVNDRPYVASSYLSVAMGQVFRDAMAGRSKDRPELAAAKIPLRAHLTMVPARGGEDLLRRLFEPLGYEVGLENHLRDDKLPAWGPSQYFDLDLHAEIRLADLLSHLFVLIPVLDDEKHYFVGDSEVEKLLRRGEGWLGDHPECETIVARYLRRRHHLTRAATAQLTREESPDSDEKTAAQDAEEEAVEKPLSLHNQRLETVLAVLVASGARRVLDLGCGEGKLLRRLVKEWQFEEIVGVDVSHAALEIAEERFERLPAMQRARVKLLQGALTYRDSRLAGYDAAAIVEVVEHLDPTRLDAFCRSVFEFARPATVVLTTPNAEYNAHWENLPAGQMRHRDHRFEWTRQQFEEWAQAVAARFGYAVKFAPIGPWDEALGAPTQMGIFERGGQ